MFERLRASLSPDMLLSENFGRPCVWVDGPSDDAAQIAVPGRLKVVLKEPRPHRRSGEGYCGPKPALNALSSAAGLGVSRWRRLWQVVGAPQSRPRRCSACWCWVTSTPDGDTTYQRPPLELSPWPW